MASLIIPVTCVNPHSDKWSITSPNTSIIVACKFENGVIIASDSRRNFGNYVNNRTANKLIKIGQRIYCGGSGAEAAVQYITDEGIYQAKALNVNSGGVSVATAAAILRNLCYNNRDKTHADFLVAGWHNDTEEHQIYSVTSGGMIHQESVCAIGSGSLYVQGYIDACYAPNMSKEQAQVFMIKTLQLAISRSNLCGGYVNMVIITNDSTEKYVEMDNL